MNTAQNAKQGWGPTGPHPTLGYYTHLETLLEACEAEGDGTFPIAMEIPKFGPTIHLLIQREGPHVLAVIYLTPEQYPELGIHHGQDMTRAKWNFIPARDQYPNTAILVGRRDSAFALAEALCDLLALLKPTTVITGHAASPEWQKPDSRR